MDATGLDNNSLAENRSNMQGVYIYVSNSIVKKIVAGNSSRQGFPAQRISRVIVSDCCQIAHGFSQDFMRERSKCLTLPVKIMSNTMKVPVLIGKQLAGPLSLARRSPVQTGNQRLSVVHHRVQHRSHVES